MKTLVVFSRHQSIVLSENKKKKKRDLTSGPPASGISKLKSSSKRGGNVPLRGAKKEEVKVRVAPFTCAMSEHERESKGGGDLFFLFQPQFRWSELPPSCVTYA